MTETTDISPEDAATAAEYVLGLLAPEDARAFAARLPGDPALAAQVEAWQIHFATLAETEIAPVAPPPALQTSIEAALFGDADRPTLWNRLPLWRGLGLAGLATSFGLAAILVLSPAPPPTAPAPLVADLAPLTGDLQFVALYDADAGVLSVRRSAGDARPGRVEEVWLIVGEDAPVSLGLIDADGRLRADLPQTLASVLPGAVLAVSDEPPGGSPTGAPTGDVLAAGAVSEI